LYQNDLFVAHAGDCRAILGIRDGTRWVGKVLTQDHQPSNLRELSRLNQDHPGEEETVAFNAGDGPWRVLGKVLINKVE
jgi:pyruvate dehydrogenase phosphatase